MSLITRKMLEHAATQRKQGGRTMTDRHGVSEGDAYGNQDGSENEAPRDPLDMQQAERENEIYTRGLKDGRVTRAQDAWDQAVKNPHAFSWFQRETQPAPRTWRDRLLFRHATMFVWVRHCVVIHVTEIQVNAIGGWQEILDTFLLPMIPKTSEIGPWGTQIESACGPAFESVHADRGDGEGPV